MVDIQNSIWKGMAYLYTGTHEYAIYYKTQGEFTRRCKLIAKGRSYGLRKIRENME